MEAYMLKCLEESGRYLETIKVYENKPADIIQGQMDTDYLSRLNHTLTSVRPVNKTDVVTLGSTFRSLSHIMDASMEDLAQCPGIGQCKASSFPNIPFSPKAAMQKVAEPSSSNQVDEVATEAEEAGKRKNKEPDLTVKSALSVFPNMLIKLVRIKEKQGKEIQVKLIRDKTDSEDT